ncbi:MAG: YaeQ family protein [Betaproteobacteria bacterium]|nr:YaeQ family protein [Betaproteobacteria bacterium]
MALKATIFKADLQIADMDRNYYQSHVLTLARHPSETDERMMVRLLAFALYAEERLEFGRGLSTDDEPALWLKDLTGAVELWIEVGLPDEREIRKACGKASRVVVLTYGGRGADLWWGQNRDKLERLRNLTLSNLPSATSQSLAALANRNMSLQCTIQDGHAWLTDGENTVHIEPLKLKDAG